MRMLQTTLAAALALALPTPSLAQASAAIASGQTKPSSLAPGEIVAAAPAEEWVAIAASDLLVMTLAPDRDGKPRQVVLQLMPPPFSQGWIGNIRKLAAAHWWDGLSINRVQDNYVVQWGDANAEDRAKAKALPKSLRIVPAADYETPFNAGMFNTAFSRGGRNPAEYDLIPTIASPRIPTNFADPYSRVWSYAAGFPVAYTDGPSDPRNPRRYGPLKLWPVHCYGMVGVGRDLAPDTGSGAELYTVIGHAPRHLDRNIALAGRVVEGIEHLSSLPRGTGALGFYEKPEQRTAIVSIRLASELPTAEQPRFEYLSTESPSFAAYAEARANRRDPFFNVPAGGADICNIPVPVRRASTARK